MGIQDVLFLLENSGLKVKFSGKGAINWEGTNKIHGNPMKPADYDESFKALNLDRFEVPSEAHDISEKHQLSLIDSYDEWTKNFKEWQIACSKRNRFTPSLRP